MRNTENIISTNRLLAVVLCIVLTGCASAPRGRTGELMAPLPRLDISSKFGMRTARRPHYGLDLRAPKGTPIAASADGKVSYAGWQNGFGKVVILDHGGRIETYYAHMSGFAVSRGDRVRQGETIGFVGRTGNATGHHLHFEVRIKGKPVDPLLHIGDTPRG